jgi:hypothetical protein
MGTLALGFVGKAAPLRATCQASVWRESVPPGEPPPDGTSTRHNKEGASRERQPTPLRDEARAAVVTVVTLTGRQVPAAVEEAAVQLLVDVWTAGLTHGVQPQDWQATTSLPTACLDALTLVERRRSTP